jgi:hypothetical protein
VLDHTEQAIRRRETSLLETSVLDRVNHRVPHLKNLNVPCMLTMLTNVQGTFNSRQVGTSRNLVTMGGMG